MVFGKSGGFSASLDVASLNGTNGFVINGVSAGDISGFAVSSAGDINGDGVDDLMIGAPGADPNGEASAGSTYVVFGNANGFKDSFDLSQLDGTNGFVLNGVDAQDASGHRVSSAGDVNGDGYDDMVIAAEDADPLGTGETGAAYVVFGSANGYEAVVKLSQLDGSNGFVIAGGKGFGIGTDVTAGDLNMDGCADIVVGATDASPGGKAQAGQSFVVFGKADGFSPVLSVEKPGGWNGFAINGDEPFDGLGSSVSWVGLNPDGMRALIVGAPNASREGLTGVGESYVVYSNPVNWGYQLPAEAIIDRCYQGFAIRGLNEGDGAGFSVSGAGDFDGDGYSDYLIGAPSAQDGEGESYIIYGRPYIGPAPAGGVGSLAQSVSAEDQFVFAPGFGNATVAGFDTGTSSQDVLDLSAFNISISDLVIAKAGTDTVVTLPSAETVTIQGVAPVELDTTDDFLF